MIPKTRRALLAVLLLAMTPLVAAEAVDTDVMVRVLARDAKLIGDAVGGARITIANAESGAVLAEGVTSGATGDTNLIMKEPRTRGEERFNTPGAAGWQATLPLAEPTLVTITAAGPLDYPDALVTTSKTMLLAPGVDVVGEGVVLELNGLIVEILDQPTAGDGKLPVKTRVRMLCSCPTEPDGLWSVATVEARLWKGAEMVNQVELAFSGETSIYTGELAATDSGTYTLEVLASDPLTANFGRTATEVEIR